MGIFDKLKAAAAAVTGGAAQVTIEYEPRRQPLRMGVNA